MGVKTRKVMNQSEPYGWLVWCPACDDSHHFRGWTFNENHESPTFSPSMLVTYHVGDPADPASGRRCHSFLVDGVWQYLDDCTHAMAGQHVPAPDWPKPDCGGTEKP